jgi:hypothetical protein
MRCTLEHCRSRRRLKPCRDPLIRAAISVLKSGATSQVVIALVVTPEGLPLAYEVLAGNTTDNTTLRDFLARIEEQYGRARRI